MRARPFSTFHGKIFLFPEKTASAALLESKSLDFCRTLCYNKESYVSTSQCARALRKGKFKRVMEQKKLDRINELARKKKSGVALSEQELAEQAALREEYILEFRASFRAQLDNTVVRYPDGSEERLSDKNPNFKKKD
jgi:uncharacterized protein YnzC (UPF0291/DUF896 family)